MDTFSLKIMNTNFYVAISKNNRGNWKEKVETWLRYVATEWSRFQSNNELDRLNQLKVGDTISLSTDLYDCLKRANDYYILTKGLFSPYLKRYIEQHGYRHSYPFKMADSGSIPIEEHHHEPFMFLNNQQVLKTTNEQIDLGGFAKGYAVERIAQWLQQEITPEYGMVDGGGDMKLWSAGDKEWTIGVAHPFHEEEELSYIKMRNGAIATSNRVFRRWKQNGELKHHLLNGQTGEVANSDVLQATVVTNSLYDAEVGTKLCFLQNDKEVQQWFEQNAIPHARLIVKEHENSYWVKGGEKYYVH